MKGEAISRERSLYLRRIGRSTDRLYDKWEYELFDSEVNGGETKEVIDARYLRKLDATIRKIEDRALSEHDTITIHKPRAMGPSA